MMMAVIVAIRLRRYSRLSLTLRVEIVERDFRLVFDDGFSQAEAKAAVRHHRGPILLDKTSRTAEMIRMRVGYEHGVNVFRFQVRLTQPVLNGLPGKRTG